VKKAKKGVIRPKTRVKMVKKAKTETSPKNRKKQGLNKTIWSKT